MKPHFDSAPAGRRLTSRPFDPIAAASQRGGAATTLVLALAVVGAGLLAWWRPWVPSPATEARLLERVAEYEAARKAGDVRLLFDLTVPDEAEAVGFDAYRGFYRQDMTRFHGLKLVDSRVDLAEGRASTEVAVDYEILPDRLPGAFRRNLQVPDGTGLRQHGQISLDWLWVHDDWYLRVDRVALTRRSADGRSAAVLDPTTEAKEDRHK
jgi:hypothetical protein